MADGWASVSRALPLPEVVPVPVDVLRRYVGVYALGGAVELEVTVEGQGLWARVAGQAALRVHPKSETRFYYRAVPAEISFQVDESGRVTGLTLHQGGVDTPAPRRG